MSTRILAVLASAVLAGCGTVIDFGPEPGTSGDPFNWQYNPELHGPDAPPRDPEKARDSIRVAPGTGSDQPAATAAPASSTASAAAGSTPAATVPAVPALPPPPPPPATPPAPESEAMFNDAIRRAVAAGDIDRALRLLEEAERLGSPSARATFIEAVGSRGQ
jgi:hypothetical protein